MLWLCSSSTRQHQQHMHVSNALGSCSCHAPSCLLTAHAAHRALLDSVVAHTVCPLLAAGSTSRHYTVQQGGWGLQELRLRQALGHMTCCEPAAGLSHPTAAQHTDKVALMSHHLGPYDHQSPSPAPTARLTPRNRPCVPHTATWIARTHAPCRHHTSTLAHAPV